MFNDVFPDIAGKEPFFSFVRGDSNQKALDAIFELSMQETDNKVVVIYGESGVGKSHLAYMFRDICIDDELDVLHRSCDRLHQEFCDWLVKKWPLECFYESYERFDAIVIEDIHRLDYFGVAKECIHEFIKRFAAQNKRVLLTSKKGPEETTWLQDIGILWVKIEKPDSKLKLGILKSYEEIAKIELQPNVRGELIESSNNIRHMMRRFNRLYLYHKLFHFEMDEELLDKISEEAYEYLHRK